MQVSDHPYPFYSCEYCKSDIVTNETIWSHQSVRGKPVDDNLYGGDAFNIFQTYFPPGTAESMNCTYHYEFDSKREDTFSVEEWKIFVSTGKTWFDQAMEREIKYLIEDKNNRPRYYLENK